MKPLQLYIGKRPACGCITAAMVDDETMTPDDLAEFARDIIASGRRLEHIEIPDGETVALKRCTHDSYDPRK